MGTLGRNAYFAVSPNPENRAGQYKTGDSAIPQLAPVKVVDDVEADANGRIELELATEGVAPVPGLHGVCVYEPWDANFAGYDPVLTTESDITDAPAATPVQLVNGSYVVLGLVNTDDFSFDGQRDYDGRIMVAGASGATISVGVGTKLMPGPGTDDDSGYWQEADTDENAWLVVTGHEAIEGNLGRSETLSWVEARLLF